MKARLFLCLALPLVACAAPARLLVDPTLQTRFGYDSNPLAVRGPAMAALGGESTLTTAASLGFGLALPSSDPAATGKFSYAGEMVRFADDASENYTTHRLGFTGQTTVAAWKLSADASALYIDGNRETFVTVAACNANATSLWRERREQWQHRAKLLAQRDAGDFRVRLLGTALDYDYGTRVRAGHVAFANRSDALLGADLGWKQSPASLWFVGVRGGAQHQATIALPGSGFEYSNRYGRTVAGWEGKLGPDTTLSFAAGPDFRHYGGTVDPRVFHDRRHTLGWFDAAFATKLTPALALTAKTTRWTWLSSTGKSAYTDLVAEVGLAWTIAPRWNLRATVKAHQCSYFPALRNDWEALGGLGVTYKLNPRWLLTADLLDHRGWNELSGVADRDFSRSTCALGASVKL